MKHRRSRLGSWAALTVALAVGCVKHYEPPTASDPHAIVKFRRRYERTPGSHLQEILRVDGRRALALGGDSRNGSVPRTDAVLVHPGAVPVEMIATFSHTQMVTVMESYACGTSTCSRSVQRSQTVVDAHCKLELTVAFAAGKNYLLELDFQGRKHCTPRCFEQEPGAEGEFHNRPCRPL